MAGCQNRQKPNKAGRHGQTHMDKHNIIQYYDMTRKSEIESVLQHSLKSAIMRRHVT